MYKPNSFSRFRINDNAHKKSAAYREREREIFSKKDNDSFVKGNNNNYSDHKRM